MNPKSRPDAIKSKLVFLKQFLARPSEVASILPSSSELVEKLVGEFPYNTLRVAVEYGPGTGAITDELLKVLPEGAHYVGAEPNPIFREHLRDIYPNLELIPDYAQNIADVVLEKYGTVDFIVSGLPCSVIPLAVLNDLFKSTHKMLRPGGEFRMFVYTHTLFLPKMHKMMDLLQHQFTSVQKTIVWKNMPPATIIRCVK